MIKCKICGQEFEFMITWKHLKKHNISSKEYKDVYGDLASESFKKLKSLQNSGKNNPNFGNRMSEQSKLLISSKNSNNVPHNKNKPMPAEQKKILSEKAKIRNKIWQESNTHPIKGLKRSQDTIDRIKEKRANQVISPQQIIKSLESKRQKGYDLAFFKGRTHTAESREKISKSSKRTALLKHQKTVIESAKRLEEYGYGLLSVDGSFMTIKCNNCGNSFSRSRQYSAPNKISKEMCHHCYPTIAGSSMQELELIDFLKSINENIELKNRKILSPKEIDIFVPRCNIGIEYNGLYWHSEVYKDKHYHLKKTQESFKKNVMLIHIFEDEWVNSKEIVKSKIKSLLGKTNKKFYARKCTAKEIDSKTANTFLNENHLQGAGRSNVRIGLYCNDQLVSVMTFLKGDISKRLTDWELNRFCSKIDTSVVGAAGKLFNNFIKKYKPETVVSFSDRRWSKDVDQSVYKKIGFEYAYCSPPNYWYIQPNCVKRFSRYSLRKPADSTMSELQLRESQGYLRIYDCGSSKWIWKKNGGI
jgi:ribosomal protein S27E